MNKITSSFSKLNVDDREIKPVRSDTYYDNTHIDSRAVRAANWDQPRGRLPRLLPDMSSPETHISLARELNLEEILKSAASCGEYESRVKSMCNGYDLTVQKRHLVIAQIRNISKLVAPADERLKSLIPIDNPARQLNLALLLFLSDFCNSPDKSLVMDLINGMPLTGTIPSANSLPEAKTEAKTTIENLLEEVETRNRKIIESLRRRPDDSIKKCWEMTQAEVLEGKVSELAPVDQRTFSSNLLNPRFVLEKTKPRLIDDLKASSVNYTAACSCTY